MALRGLLGLQGGSLRLCGPLRVPTGLPVALGRLYAGCKLRHLACKALLVACKLAMLVFF